MKRGEKKTIVFRCDASSVLGWGHMIRDLTIAEELKWGNEIIFGSVRDSSNGQIKKQGFKLFLKEEKENEQTFLRRIKTRLTPDVLVVDRKYLYFPEDFAGFKKIIMIDNFSKGLRAADEIIFPNAHFDKERFKKFSSAIKKVKHGFEYVVLRNEILRAKSQGRHFHNPPSIALITGGTDPKGVLLKLLSWLKEIDLDANIMAFFGRGFSFPGKLRKIKKDLPSNFRILPYSLKEIAKADIAICTFGQSIYEMIYLGIPTICVSHCRENADGAAILKKRHKVIEDMGYIDNIAPPKIYQAITRLLSDKRKPKDLIDGKGAKRIAKICLRK